MTNEKSNLQKRIEANEPILLAELSPPSSGDPAPIHKTAQCYAGKVHAVGISDNRDRVGMSALAAAALVLNDGIEPILHVVTRDRNRIALISDFLGAQSLGIRNVLCTSGTHQTLGRFRAAKNVFDIDSTQLLQAYANLATDGSLVGQPGINGCDPACLGAVASPSADPLELQLIRLAKKIEAGAQFLITEPIFDFDRFDAWWKQVKSRGIHQQAAFVAGIQLLADADQATAFARRRPSPLIPEAMLQRLTSESDRRAQRAVGIDIAVESIHQLSDIEGLRGFQIVGNGDRDAVLEVIERSALGSP